MNDSPRLVALLAFGALAPFAVYAVQSGELTAVTAAVGAVNILLIAGSLLVLFGATEGQRDGDGENGHGTATA